MSGFTSDSIGGLWKNYPLRPHTTRPIRELLSGLWGSL